MSPMLSMGHGTITSSRKASLNAAIDKYCESESVSFENLNDDDRQQLTDKTPILSFQLLLRGKEEAIRQAKYAFIQEANGPSRPTLLPTPRDAVDMDSDSRPKCQFTASTPKDASHQRLGLRAGIFQKPKAPVVLTMTGQKHKLSARIIPEQCGVARCRSNLNRLRANDIHIARSQKEQPNHRHDDIIIEPGIYKGSLVWQEPS